MRDSTVHTYIHYMNCSSQLLLMIIFFLINIIIYKLLGIYQEE